jgi:four helix bundle protein
MLGVTRHEDLHIYKLAVELRRDVLRLTRRDPVRRDFKFVSQIRSATRGAPRNIAEGFSRFAPTQFHQFLSYAKASLDETKSHIEDGHESGYFNDGERERLLILTRRTLGGTCRLMRYVESPAAHRAHEAILRAGQIEVPRARGRSRRSPAAGQKRASEPEPEL